MLYYLGKFFQYLPPYVALSNQKHCIIYSPQKVSPRGTMPKTGQSPYNEKISEMLSFRPPVSPQWNIDIVSKPGAQRDMPSAPKVFDRDCNIGIIKIF